MADVRAAGEQIQGQGATGSAVVGNPVLVAGSDGTNARTLKTDTDGTVSSDLTKVGGTAIAIGQAAMAASLPVTVASDQSAVPIKLGTVAVSTVGWAAGTSLNTAVTLSSLGGYGLVTVEFWETDSGTAVLSAGAVTFEVDAGSGQWFSNAGVRMGTYTAESSYTVTGGKQFWSFDLDGATSFRVRLSTILGQSAGTGTATANFRVQASAIETTQTVVVGQPTAASLQTTAAQGGTWTVQPGNTANTTAWKVDGSAVTQPVSQSSTPWLAADQATTSGGASIYSFLSTAAVQAAAIKGSAGQVYALHFFNTSATIAYVRLYNQTTSPASTDTANIVYRALIPGNTAGAGFVVPIPPGVVFATGIGIRVSAAVADNDATALAANVVLGNVFYK